MNVYDYIKNYARVRNIKNYDLKSKFFTINDTRNPLQLSGGTAFIYRIFAEGEIQQITDIQKKFLEVSTPSDFWDISPAVCVTDWGTVQKVESNCILTAESTINFKLFEGTADAMFSSILNFCVQYIYFKAIPDVEETDKSKIKVKVDF